MCAAPASDTNADTWSWTGLARRGEVLVPEPTRCIAGRYRLLDLLGQGGSGQVWRARDTLLDEDVAVKLVAAAGGVELDRARREVVALRWARLPGVVGLRDDGSLPEAWFLVMDLVPGLAFPGRPGPLSWQTLAPLARRLMEVLAGMHAAGVVHRDLKPANVLVEPGSDRLVLVDLGMAVGRPMDRRPIPGQFAGTPRYASPEQIVGRELDGRSDLYAAGIMLFEALTGRVPHDQNDGHLRLLGRRLREPAPSIAPQAPELPPEIAALLDRLLQREPQDRPQSAWEVLSALGGRLPPPLCGQLSLPSGRSCSPEELMELFHGPDLFLHLREDAARALWERTGGQPERVRQELSNWLRSGLAVWDQGAARLDRVDVERLLCGVRVGSEPTVPLDPVPLALALAFPDATVSRVALALALPEDQVRARVEAQVLAGDAWLLSDGRVGCQPLIGGQDATTRALRRTLSAALPHSHPGRVRLLAEAGASAHELLLVCRAVLVDPDLPPGEAIVVVERALQVARLEAAPEVEEELLRERASLSLRLEAAVPLRHALYELGRGIAAGLPLDPVETLVRGALHAVTGSLPLAREILAPLPPFALEGLEAYRVAYLASAARCEGLAEEERVLRGLEAWAQGAPWRGAWLQGWWGLHRYRRGEYALAAEHHQRAAAGKRDRVGRLSSRANAIAALLEVDPARAVELLPAQVAEAQALRCARLELSLVCKLHSARYRIGLDVRFDAELVAQAARVREREAAQLALHQAASSWRRGQPGQARVVCQTAQSLAARSGSAEIALLARALSVELGADLDDIDTIARAASVLEAPSIQAQILFLLGRAGRRPELLDLAREHARQSGHAPAVRLELLSLDEILSSPQPWSGA